jgi:hypothetical protein
MHRLREILRLKWLGRSHRQVARALGVSASTVASVATDARALGRDSAAVEALSDAELQAPDVSKARDDLHAAGAGRRGAAHGVATLRRDVGALALRISRRASRGRSLYRLLRALPGLAKVAVAGHATGACCMR